MAAPNINSSSLTAYGKTATVTPANTSDNVLLSNAASSGKVLKVNRITAANVDGTSAYEATVAFCSSAAGAGTQYKLASTISVPAKVTLVIVDMDTPLYLEEDKSLVCKSQTASKLDFVLSYEELS